MKCLNPNCKDPTLLEKLRRQSSFEFEFCPVCGESTRTSNNDGIEGSNDAESSSSEHAPSVENPESQKIDRDICQPSQQLHDQPNLKELTHLAEQKEDLPGKPGKQEEEEEQDEEEQRQQQQLQEKEEKTIEKQKLSEQQLVQQGEVKLEDEEKEQLQNQQQHEPLDRQQNQRQPPKEEGSLPEQEKLQQLQQEKHSEQNQQQSHQTQKQKQQEQHQQRKEHAMDLQLQQQQLQQQQQQQQLQQQHQQKLIEEQELIIQQLRLEKQQLQEQCQQQRSFESTDTSSPTRTITSQSSQGSHSSPDVKIPPRDEFSNGDSSQSTETPNDPPKPTYSAVSSRNENKDNKRTTVTSSIVQNVGGYTRNSSSNNDKESVLLGSQKENGNKTNAAASGNDKSGEVNTQEGYFYRKPQLEPAEHKQTGKNKEKNSSKPATTGETQSSTSRQTTTETTGPTTKNDYVTIVFHALLAPHFNYDASKGDILVVRGGFPFNGWQQDQLQMIPIRDYNGYILFTGETTIPLQDAHRSIPYKYVVVKTNKSKYLWEEIVGHPYEHGMHTNRCMTIHERKRKPYEIWHQYDDAVFSAPKFWESIRNSLPWVNPSMDPAEGRYISMEIMLPNLNLFGYGTTGSVFMETVNQVIYCITNAKIERSGKKEPLTWSNFCLNEALQSYFEPRMALNLSLQSSSDENVQAYCLGTSLVVTSMISNVMDRYKECIPTEDQFKMIFRCLALQPKNSIKVLEILTSNYFSRNTLKTKFSEAILHLCQYVISHCNDVHEWLLAIPLVHFLTESSSPFTNPLPISGPDALTDKSLWGIQTLDMQRLKYRSNISPALSPIRFLSEVQPLFKLDPLLQRTFMWSLSLTDLVECATRADIPAHEVCWALAKVLHEKTIVYIDEKEVLLITACFSHIDKRLTQDARNNQGEAEIQRKDELESLAAALSQVIETFLMSVKDNIQLTREALDILSKTLNSLKKLSLNNRRNEMQDSDESNNFHRIQLEDAIKKVKEKLKKCFNESLTRITNFSWNQELEVYSVLYHVQFEDEEMHPIWEKELEDLLETRVEKVEDLKKIELYCMVDLTKAHTKLERFLREMAFSAIKTITETGRNSDQNKALETMKSQTDVKKLGDLMSQLLKQSWPKSEDIDEEELLKHILSWKPMRDFLEFFRENRTIFTQESQCHLIQAVTLLDVLQQRISNQNITVHLLKVLRNNTETFLELVILAKQDETSKHGGNEFKETYHDTVSLLERFEEERKELESFLRMNFILKNVDVEEIRKKMEIDVSTEEIKDVAILFEDKQPLVIFFDLEEELKEMVSKLHRIYQNEIFQKMWQKTFENARQESQNGKMDFDELLELVWRPTFSNCCDILTGVVDGTISLAEVDEHFEVFKDRYGQLENDLLNIGDVGEIAIEKQIINEQVGKIARYHVQQACSEAADKILEFQKTMELDENGFAELEEFRQQVCPNSKRKPLDSLHEGTNEIGERLVGIGSERIKCLDAIMESKEFINWLHEELSDASEVSVLVDFAMTSAGDGDIEIARVGSLHTATTAFKPIIFDLEKSDDFIALMDMLEGIWAALDENKHLPEQLRDTSRHLEWIKNVKDFHGSGVMSSIRQVEVILGHGILKIGRLTSDDELDINKVISLILPDNKAKELQKEIYTLEELKDLQSKLMLIAGKTSGKKEDAESFNGVMQGALSVGTAFLNLCEAGEVSHLDWKEDFRCSKVLHLDVTEDLQLRSNKLTEDFMEWISVLEVQRKECNELNYFTAKQLLYLRKEIADLRRGRPLESLEVQLYSLLSNVLPKVSTYHLQQALIAIDIDVDEPQDTEFKDEQDLRQKYAKFFEKAFDPDLDYSEEVAIAAIVACDCTDDHSDLLLWCIKNYQKEDLIADLCKKGSRDPRFQTLFADVICEDRVQELAEKMEVDGLDDKNDEDGPAVSRLDQTLDGRYLSLQELSTLLQTLKEQKKDDEKMMQFPEYLEKGKPNLMIVPQCDILPTVIGFYLYSDVFPSRYEVLVCTQDTSLEEVDLLLRRALANKGDMFYCLANADKLSLDDSVKVKQAFDKLEREYDNDFQLVIICSSEQETKSQIATAFDKFRVKGAPRCPRPKEVLLYLKTYFKAPPPSRVHFGRHEIEWISAAEVQEHSQEDSRFSVLVVSSERSGTGKSLMVQDFVRNLKELESNKEMAGLLEEMGKPISQYVVAPLLGKTVNVSDIVGFLLPYSLMSDVPVSRIFHFDVAPSVESGLESLLFNLLYLGSIQDHRGHIWKRNPRDLYVIEMTSVASDKPNSAGTHRFFYNELPSIHCITPIEVLKKIDRPPPDTSEFVPLFNDGILYSESVQRVSQYLFFLENNPELLHHFGFDQEQLQIASDVSECLPLLIRYCGVQDPSWSELQHFVDFLNYQLSDCERSAFCQLDNIDDVLEGFRLFVVQFMVFMSQDFSSRSLGGENILKDQDEEREEEEDIAQYQLRRKWESSPHPYLFFNHPDHQTFTFFGFRIDVNGNLVDPKNGDVLREGLMARRLRTGLYVQRVNFEEDFESLDKFQKIRKICQVLGVEWLCDPDESYELTEDNAKKIMAIHMRFRCGIPVVIMGETGCGKTKLIRYLCGLQRGYHGPRNMLLVKVHGGTTFRDIEKKVLQAKKIAKENLERGVETVLFFDEVNTTEALDLVKEVMVDRRLNGVPLGQDAEGLRFIAACNPYRKHEETMIRKLESAGLGYSVKTAETTDRIGRVPLRHLVYRVHALPESMLSLIWDFGQLKPEIEILYIIQIVKRHISMNDHGIPKDDKLVEAIAKVLAVSQQYMREQKDECSFVSLRDVERTMNVMVWFYQHREAFGPLLQKIAADDHVFDERRMNSGDSENSEDSSSSDDESLSTKSTKKELSHYFKEGKTKDDTKFMEEASLPTASRGFATAFEEMNSMRASTGAPINLVSVPVDDRNPREQDEGHMRPSLFRIPHIQTPLPDPIPSTSGWVVEDDECPRMSHARPQNPFKMHQSAANNYDDDMKTTAAVVEEDDEDDEDDKDDDYDDLSKPLDPVTWSLILAIGVCYHAKLQEREQYRQTVADAFQHPCCLYGGADRILQEISRCQEAMLNELNLGPNIARNSALSENVFMMVVCIELRIPLFVIGKPGSSKSLAKTVVAANMEGDASKSKLFKSFKQVQMSAHQCSPLSTPEGIQETFRQCSNLQKGKNPDKFVSVVVLDEVGLAEDSPLLPLKTLHPLLEDGVTSSDEIIETDEKPERVAFIGISNWALDPAKMNRGIMLSRDVPGVKELEKSAMGICASDKDVQERVKLVIPALAQAYSEVYQEQKELEVLKESKKDEFFGLRDFYCLIKMVCNQAKKTRLVPDWTMIEYAVRRNFGGLDVGFDPVGIFKKRLENLLYVQQADGQVSSLDLIKSSLDKDPEEKGSRYLLILTENHAALTIVQQYLTESRNDENDPVLIFGSSFPKDLEYTQVCRNINDIKVCMETGRTVILLNMESLYEGLYDALNQYYVKFGGSEFVDLGLGTHRVKCKVDPNFRLIVIAEKNTVYKDFPIPLINRLEKHFLVLSSSLTEPQRELVKQLEIWVKRFSTIGTPAHQRQRKFTLGDAFVGYHDDTIPSVVFQVCSKLRQDGTTLDEDNKTEWEETVLSESKKLLVQCCTPDSIVRLHSSGLKYEAENIWNMYFQEQYHSSLVDYLRHREHDQGLLIQVSTHSRLLSDENLEEVAQALDLHRHYVQSITLQQFQTEHQFCDCVGNFFAHLGGERGLLVVQCIASDLSFNLLACARHLLLKQRAEITDDVPVHIIVIIQLPRIPGGYPDFVGFQGQQWESVHIDELSEASFYIPSLEDVKDQSLSQLFKSSIDKCFDNEKENTLDAVGVLKQCIQSAAQRIDDTQSTVARATERIVILLDLLYLENSELEDDDSFPYVLISRVHDLLVERDERSPYEGTKWSTSEAMEHTDLQETGTYRKALWRKIQNAIVPILSEVIAFIDKDSNLDLLLRGAPWLRELWLKLFQDYKLTELHYTSFLTENDVIRSQVPVTSSGRDSHVFRCLLPFSWLIKERVDKMMAQAKGIAERSNCSVVDCLRGIISNSDICDVMNVINENQEAVERYIHDFVHMNYNPAVDGEDTLVVIAIIVTTRQLHDDSGSSSFNFPDVALVHEAYSRIDVRIACFRQLVHCNPSIVENLLQAFTVNEDSMILDAIALLMCLESLEPSMVDMDDEKKREGWCEHVIAIRAPTESIMGNLNENKYDIDEKVLAMLEQSRHLWERITAIRLFIEHIYLSGKKSKLDPRNISTLANALGEDTDFSKTPSIEAVQLFLMECIKSFQSTSKADVNEFRRRCNSFFMELTSLLCFGDKKSSLDPDVFDIFMRYITGSGSSQTKNFSPFPDFEVDKTPVVRSFLLQQLLTSRDDESVKKYIQRYLVEAQQLSSDEGHVTQVCQLTVDCIEDSFATKMTQQNIQLSLLIGVVAHMVSQSGEILIENQNPNNTLDVNVLDAISNLRHALTLSAEWIFKSQITDDIAFEDEKVSLELKKLPKVLQELFSRLIDRAPVLYLLKQLARRFGGAAVRELTQRQELEWLIPRDLEGFQFTEAADDRFTVHGRPYIETRDALAQAMMSSNPDDFINIIKASGDGSESRRDIMVLLSVYREITCSYRQPQQRLPKELQQLQEFLGQPEYISAKARTLAFKLLDNSHSEGFSALSAQPGQPAATINLSEIVMHTMIVLFCSQNDKVLSTLKSLMDSPMLMKDSFLPTMPEDDFERVRQGLREQVKWYECPAGHRYSIGDCGQANQESRCPECKSGIGGTGYKLLPGNRELPGEREDRSNRGHILGKANAAPVEPGRDGLTPAAVYIMRLIMHSAILAGTCRHPEEARQLFSPPLEDDDLQEFVWAHIERDLRCLATALNRSEEEALLTVHCVLHHMTECSEIIVAGWSVHSGNGVLNSSANRRRWETEFSSSFIEPVLSKLAEELQDCLTAIANDQPVGSDRLMREIYELEQTDRFGQLSPMHPCFWRYRAKITVDHAKQMFSEKMGRDKKYKLMRHFFQEENKLRLARYIPEIYRLQQLLTDNCSRRIEKTNADKMSVKDFQESLTDKSKKAEFKALLTSFKSAWKAVSAGALENQGRFKLTSETCSLPMNEKTPLSYLLPASNGHESCTTAVLFYLVTAHNEFLETYHNHTYGNARNISAIPDTEITQSQMLSYDPERDLLPIIHAHCHYSLEVGHGTKVEYDWTAIQRHLIDRLMRGKSVIVFKEAKFSFLRYKQASLFLDVREKIEQENIPATSVKMICSQLRHFNDVCEVKESLELAIGFLATGGGDSRKLISEYLHDVLRIPQERGLRSHKAEQTCQLRHIVHLWQIVTSEKAKILLRQKQDPFQDLSDCFKEKIPNTMIRDLKKSLKSLDTRQLSLDLVEMITLDLNKESEQFVEESFQEYLDYFMEDSNRFENLVGDENIKLKHAVNVWEIVVDAHF